MSTDKTPACPNPQKKRYATREAADNAARRSQIAIEEPLHPYICICTWWHLSKQPTNAVPADAVADPDDIHRLELQSDTAFRETVALEARGKLPMNDRIALRHTSLLLRWNRTLKELRTDINQELNNRRHDTTLATHDWRKRAEGYRDVLTLRLQENRDLRAHELEQAKQQREATKAANLTEQANIQQRAAASNAARRAARNEETDRALDRLGIPQHATKELRRQAGERAIQRLIDAHGPEFSQYLAEECAVLGAPLPNRVRKYLTDNTLARTA
ncbi:hypothetical protein [Streptomyces olivaceoviridis]|uniref:hypothetical protein n=1 Tax=Streptomyces olivaceoviridis TaxID=1921 RepID=UPI0036910516